MRNTNKPATYLPIYFQFERHFPFYRFYHKICTLIFLIWTFQWNPIHCVFVLFLRDYIELFVTIHSMWIHSLKYIYLHFPISTEFIIWFARTNSTNRWLTYFIDVMLYAYYVLNANTMKTLTLQKKKNNAKH